MTHNLKLTGAMPPMIIPFKENGDVNYKKLENNIEKWNETKLSGYLAIGSNSEACYLTQEEKLKVVEITVKTAAKDKFVMAGTGMESTRETIELTNACAKLGVKAALVLTPFYYKAFMTEEALLNHFKQVADNSDSPVLIYNVPKFTGVNVSLSFVKDINSYNNIVGMKDSTGDVEQLKAFKNTINNSFNLLVGTAGAWYPALELGVRSGIMALANLAPNECCEILDLYLKDRKKEAKALWERMVPVNKAVTTTYGISGLKYAMKILGYEAGEVRSPLLPLKEFEKEDIRNILKMAELL